MYDVGTILSVSCPTRAIDNVALGGIIITGIPIYAGASKVVESTGTLAMPLVIKC